VITYSAIQSPVKIRAKKFFKTASFVGPVALVEALNFPSTRALAQHVEMAGAGPSPAPTTKMLAIGRLTAKATPTAPNMILPLEIRATTRPYVAGKIDQWYLQPYEKGGLSMTESRNPR
jgi:hypothetical protein